MAGLVPAIHVAGQQYLGILSRLAKRHGVEDMKRAEPVIAGAANKRLTYQRVD
jgi:hypothetical protein